MFMHMDVLTQFYLLQQMHNHIQNELQHGAPVQKGPQTAWQQQHMRNLYNTSNCNSI